MTVMVACCRFVCRLPRYSPLSLLSLSFSIFGIFPLTILQQEAGFRFVCRIQNVGQMDGEMNMAGIGWNRSQSRVGKFLRRVSKTCGRVSG